MFGDLPREFPQLFAFVLMPEYSTIPMTSAIEVLRLANRVADQSLYDWNVYTVDGAPVAASNGLPLNPAGSLNDINDRAVVVVCGGLNVQHNTNKALINWLRMISRRGREIGSLCTAGHVLALAGLLEGHRCTVHWENIPSFVETFPDLDLSGKLYEIDRNRFTCAGGTATIDLMLALVAQQHGDTLAEDVAEQILHMPIRRRDEDQRLSVPARIGARHPKLVKIIEAMEENLENPWTPGELADQVGLSTRQLERLFKRYLDRTPKRFYLDLRLRKARLLLLQTNQSVINIALACGFSSPSHFSKCYRSLFGRTPYRERGTPETPPGHVKSAQQG